MGGFFEWHRRMTAYLICFWNRLSFPSGNKTAGMAVYGEDGFDRAIHNIENAPFRTKFDKDMQKMKGYYGIGAFPILNHSH